MRKSIFYFLLLLTLSCQKEKEAIVIQEELKPYFDLFKLEAAKRGIAFDPIEAGITTEFTDISDKNIIAQCTRFNSNVPSVIRVDVDYWSTASDNDKEFYLFHELGHCFLKRGHLDTKDGEGNCTSIMHGSQDVCKFIYTKITRDVYLDELFKK